MKTYIEKHMKQIIVLLIITNILSATLSTSIWLREGYTEKVLLKLGVIEYPSGMSADYWAIRSWSSCIENLDLDVDVVFLGDSIIMASTFQDYFRDVHICNLGYAGDDLYGMDQRLDTVKNVKPEKVFVLGGINDLGSGVSIDDVYSRYLKLITDLKNELPDATIYIQSILPINEEMTDMSVTNNKITEANKKIEQVADENDVVYIDLYSIYVFDGNLPEELTIDGVHLHDEAYDRWAEAIAQYAQ